VPDRVAPFALSMIERRAVGEPLQYVLGRWGFRGLELLVDRRVLIPRPETEAVADVALREIRGLGPRLGPRRPVVVDLGTGSGAIALAVAVEVPGARVWATDVSADALAVARANLAGLGSRVATRVQLRQGSWFGALPDGLRGSVDLIVSNPPYVAEDEDLPLEVALWEPEAALRAGPTGLEALVEIVAEAPRWLRRPGRLVVEIAPHQAAAAEAMADQAGFDDVRVRPDLTGRLRVLACRLAGHERT
jgi:release factor glutamine methyltransferase